MNSILLLITIQGVLVLLWVAIFVVPARVGMERRARTLLSDHPNADRKSVYLSFPSVRGKRALMELRIAEIETDGWIYLRATEASPWRTLRSWGGGLTLHFIRPPGENGSRSPDAPPRHRLKGEAPEPSNP
jgi:hypothetical protein